jgi:SAM-dependent methyltransferase
MKKKQAFSWRQRASWWCIARMTPWLRSSQEKYFECLEELVWPGIRILDLGCGKEFLMSWFAPQQYGRWSASIVKPAAIFGIDPYLPSLQANSNSRRVCAFADRVPFAADSFDLVTANMVMEHVDDGEAVLKEAFRVLRPGGAFVFHTPNLRTPLVRLAGLLPHRLKQALVPAMEGGRTAGDVFPTHYHMNTEKAVTAAAALVGFEAVSVRHVFTSPITQFLGPLVFFELCIVRLCAGEWFARWRPDLICLLRKPAAA